MQAEINTASIELETRTCCNKGCNRKFRVMPGSQQLECSVYCNGDKPPAGMGPKQRQRLQKYWEAQRMKAKAQKLAVAEVKVERRLEVVEAKAVECGLTDKVTPSEEELAHQRWVSYVDRAKHIVRQFSVNRLALADLAIAACNIKHGGGDHWSKFAHVHTLKNFAAEVGVSYKTLHNYVRVRRDIKDAIPNEEWDESDWGAAVRTANKVGKKTPKEKVREVYSKERKRKGPKLSFHTLIKRMSHARHFLRTVELDRLDREDLERMLELSDNVSARLREYLAINGKS